MNEIAVRLARRGGRATSSIRLLLENAASEGSATVRAPDGPLGPRERALVLRAVRAGVSRGRIGHRIARTAGGVARALDVARLDALAALELMPSGGGKSDGAGYQHLRLEFGADQLVLHDDPWWFETDSVRTHDLRSCGADSALGPSGERMMVSAYAALRGWAASAVARSDRTRPDPRLIDEAETALRWASRLKRRLLRATVPLILRTLAEREGEFVAHEGPGIDLALVRCLLAASVAIDALVPARGGRLAAPVSLVLARALGGPSRDEAVLPGTAAALRAVLIPWDRHLAIPFRVRRGVALMPNDEAAPLLARFGTPTEPPVTQKEIASRFGVTGAAWWSLYRRAIRLGARQSCSDARHPRPSADR